MGITIFKIFIWGGISLDKRSEIATQKRSRKTNLVVIFQPYIQRYTSLNENFEYSYPLNVSKYVEQTTCR